MIVLNNLSVFTARRLQRMLARY